MQHPKVLIVDDNLLNLELAGDLLELESWSVRLVDNGPHAITEASTNPPDLILMDMRMPGMSGLEAMLELRQSEITRNIPIVVLTASVMVGEQERLLQAGFDGFMQKPISVDSFADEVRSYLIRTIHESQ